MMGRGHGQYGQAGDERYKPLAEHVLASFGVTDNLDLTDRDPEVPADPEPRFVVGEVSIQAMRDGKGGEVVIVTPKGHPYVKSCKRAQRRVLKTLRGDRSVGQPTASEPTSSEPPAPSSF